jgi:hypothetical protein
VVMVMVGDDVDWVVGGDDWDGERWQLSGLCGVGGSGIVAVRV